MFKTKKMKQIITIIIICTYFNMAAQEKEIIYKQNYDGKRMTESEYINMKNGFEDKMKKAGNVGEIKEVIVDSVTKNIVFKNFDLSFVSITTNEVEHINSYLNKKLPSTELRLLNSKKIKISDFEGKPTLLSFWFTKCAPCIKELPALESLKEKYGSKVNFVAITFNDEEEIKSFLSKKDFNYKHIIDAQKFIDEIGLNTYPRNIILDKNGIVQLINDEIPSNEIIENKKQTLKFDLSEYEKYIENLL